DESGFASYRLSNVHSTIVLIVNHIDGGVVSWSGDLSPGGRQLPDVRNHRARPNQRAGRHPPDDRPIRASYIPAGRAPRVITERARPPRAPQPSIGRAPSLHG